MAGGFVCSNSACREGCLKSSGVSKNWLKRNVPSFRCEFCDSHYVEVAYAFKMHDEAQVILKNFIKSPNVEVATTLHVQAPTVPTVTYALGEDEEILQVHEFEGEVLEELKKAVEVSKDAPDSTPHVEAPTCELTTQVVSGNRKFKKILQEEFDNTPSVKFLIDMPTVVEPIIFGSFVPEPIIKPPTTPEKVVALVKKCFTTVRKVVCKRTSPIRSSTAIVSISNFVMKQARKSGFIVELCGKKATRASFKKRSGKTELFLRTKHQDGRKSVRDCDLDEYFYPLITHTLETNGSRGLVSEDDIKHGDSGLAILKSRLLSRGESIRGTFGVVRGKIGSFVIDALGALSKSLVNRVDHYSDKQVAAEFWNGFNRRHLQLREKPNTHECTRDIAVELCGEATAEVMFMLQPIWRITCTQCMRDLKNNSVDAREEFRTRCDQILKNEDSKIKKFEWLHWVLEEISKSEQQFGSSLAIFGELQSLIGDRQIAPFSHLNTLKDCLVKAKFGGQEDAENGMQALREIVRWHMNRTESIAQGSLKSFRNKISSKAQVNMALMCDNQLDTNGNFVWGMRAYHAKRFFKDYFNAIEPGQGYSQYIERRNPRGTRKLAIGNLIIPLELSAIRAHLVGERIEAEAITNACISRKHNNYHYSCCCVTMEDGSPLYSELLPPTKNHLVIGNAGDPKYVDLPPEKDLKLYIVKEGYCYLNIFLAMLIDVPEDGAKDFTKRVRDVVIPRLGQWPTLRDVATMCYFLTIFYPETKRSELPRILVHHKTKTIHVIDSYGSLSTGYHVLKCGSVGQLVSFASDDTKGDLASYQVGGLDVDDIKFRSVELLVKGIVRPNVMKEILEDEPLLLIFSIVSPCVLLALFNSGSLEMGMQMWLKRSHTATHVFATLETLAVKMTKARTLVQQVQLMQDHASILSQAITIDFARTHSYAHVLQELEVVKMRYEANAELGLMGFAIQDQKMLERLEKNYGLLLQQAWGELTLLEKWSSISHSRKYRTKFSESLTPRKSADFNVRYDYSAISYYEMAKRGVTKACSWGSNKVKRCVIKVGNKLMRFSLGAFLKLLPNYMQILTVVMIINYLIKCHVHVMRWGKEYEQMLYYKRRSEVRDIYAEIIAVYKQLEKEKGTQPTRDEFEGKLETESPRLYQHFSQCMEEVVDLQSRNESIVKLEQIVAMFALLAMAFGDDRSDAIYKCLTKVKSLVGITEQNVRYQALDDIKDVDLEKKLVVDFELDVDSPLSNKTFDVQFQDWWTNQLEQNRVVSHYRLGGTFVEFTRANCAKVCTDISHGNVDNEFLVRGAVGSGKSTGLPAELSTRGHVLLIEPTRPLTENVCKQLRGSPFNLNPTMRMRGASVFGSTKITVMTSGFALHYYANNPQYLRDIQFVIFDECHVIEAPAMAFYSLLKEYAYAGRILKVSATPPGRECEFSTQFPVRIHIEESLTFEQFARAQGSNGNADVLPHGNNILVYVASYAEVDALEKQLTSRGYMVTKVDGRTMKTGNIEIKTRGVDGTPHFIVATNIIENGVTLDIEVVVDFGTKVSAELDIDNRMFLYKKHPISYAERVQRLGRVGRVKPGFALRIGSTEKGIPEIPQSVATEAAFLCFAYNLPVMTHNVSTSLLSGCTVKQARVMMDFELSPFLMVELVKSDGTMHPEIHRLLKHYKLRDSEITLSKLSIPSSNVCRWMSVESYKRCGVRLDIEDKTFLPFHCKDVPEKVYENLWRVVRQFASDAGFGRMSSASACSVAYTLKTDLTALPRTIQIVEHLLTEEFTKKSHFEATLSNITDSSHFSLLNIIGKIKSRYMTDHSSENIRKLQNVLAQLKEFYTFEDGNHSPDVVQNYSALRTVQYQTAEEIASHIELKGRWDKTRFAKDFVVAGFVLVGGAYLVYTNFITKTGKVKYQGFSTRQRQKLKFRKINTEKGGYEVHGNDTTMENHFGSAYTKKGKSKGVSHGTSVKNRKFVHIYGLDPAEYSTVRYLDPLTGETIEQQATQGLDLVQDHFGKLREHLIATDALERELVNYRPGIQAFFMKNGVQEVMKVDLTPHNPFQVGKNTNKVSGYMERAGELRMTGPAVQVTKDSLPALQETDLDVDYEAKSVCRGVRDYNPIAQSVCLLTNESNNAKKTNFGIGFGPLIITNGHLFVNNNGILRVQTGHGTFVCPNTTTLKIMHIPGRDMILIRMPKDFAPFPMKLKFREPEKGEKVCMVGTLFQNKLTTTLVSEDCMTFPRENSHFWKHWISTKEGHCGLPLVATHDGCLVGIHNLGSTNDSVNYYTAFPEDFSATYLNEIENLKWTSNWLHNGNNISWGGLKITDDQPSGLFKTSKLISDLMSDFVNEQSREESTWLSRVVCDNLQVVAKCPGQLVTKHVVRGKCPLFDLYLSLNEDARNFFAPLLGHYQKSRLNREAYIKDIMKYSEPIIIGEANDVWFRQAIENVKLILESGGMPNCEYITDPESILSALNMNAAVGALYSGKKKDYFKDFSESDKDDIIKQSCERLYLGKLGVWNGSLKAELRSKEKVEANKTRTFTAAPLDTLLAGKVCVDDFNNMFYALNLKCPWTVGMTKFYATWHKFLMELPEGWIYCDADGSRFDSSLTPYLLNAVLEIRLAFMESWDVGEQMLRNLYTEIIYTPIATPDGSIVKKFKGNNSGQPSTVVDNTLMVLIAMQYSLIGAGIRLSEQHTVVKYFANGDDLLIAVNPKFEGILDGFKENFSNLGLNYDFTSRHRNKSDVWFMSHRGVERDGFYIPKLEEERIVSILEWTRSDKPEHRMEAICASMIEAWGYPVLLHEVRKFYQFVLEQEPYKSLAASGNAPYIAETALKHLYLGERVNNEELEKYANIIHQLPFDDEQNIFVKYQSGQLEGIDAGGVSQAGDKNSGVSGKDPKKKKDKDVDVGTTGTHMIPRLKRVTNKMKLPKVKGGDVLNVEHLLEYVPDQVSLGNTRATQAQFQEWYERVQAAYELTSDQMRIVMNGLMVWCIENGTSPNINGSWVMMDGDEQVEYPLKPIIENAQPTFRQIMAHFSDAAEAYIEMRNAKEPYMPRYGLKRNLNVRSLARYAFDFYEVTSRTPDRAREAHFQMKEAALHGVKNRMFGLDGGVGNKEENTERHTIDDVNQNMHNLLGMRMD